MFKEFIKEHLGRIIGTSTGLIVGVLFLTIGFWRTLLLAICVFAGYYLGGGKDNQIKIVKFFSRAYNAIFARKKVK